MTAAGAAEEEAFRGVPEGILRRLELLPPAARARLESQVRAVDWGLMERLRRGAGLAESSMARVAPVPYVRHAERGKDPAFSARAQASLKKGGIGFVLFAGGQASRLGWDGPKGTFPIGPVSDRSLFRILCEKLARAGRRFGVTPFLAVTTSEATDGAIREAFAREGCYGLPAGRVDFVCQASLPALDERGAVLLETPERIFTSPDGHGGAAVALESSGLLERWETAGVTAVSTFQVDNPLLRLLDLDFLGRLREGGPPIVTKIVLKSDPGERVGVVASRGGRPAIVEYSELSAEEAARRDPDGHLTYRLGSIGVHAFELRFLRRELRGNLPFHRAIRPVPCVDEAGRPTRVNGQKFERFLFDLFPCAPAVTVVECLREREFAPLKNAEGDDSPDSVRAAMRSEYLRWHIEAGRTPPAGPIEFSPLEVDGPEDLVQS